MSHRSFRLYLHTKNVSAADLATLLNEKRQVVQNWCARGLPPARIFQVAEALKVSTDDLRPYVNGERLDPQALLDMEIDAFIERMRELPLAQRRYALERLDKLDRADRAARAPGRTRSRKA